MLDRPVRRLLHPTLARIAVALVERGIRPNHLTGAALLLAMVAAGLASRHFVVASVVLWLASRLLDGLDGEAARVADLAEHDRDIGGFYDIIGDFAAYAAIPLGVAVAQPDARLAVAFLLATYYLSGATFLAFSSLAERRGIVTDDRSFQFIGRIAEGTETIIVHTALLAWPGAAQPIAGTFAGVVALSVIERVLTSRRLLRNAPG
ncbi:MAG: phosphatidylglycerophosphate synthase [Glaciecola sp.]|jgi:phosphatidylglycerophosphate synthase